MSVASLGERFIAWAKRQRSIVVLVQIGSQTRSSGVGAADRDSDWDFQIVTREPEALRHRAGIGDELGAPLSYVMRGGRLGSAAKITAVFEDGELDVVVIPFEQFAGAAALVKAGKHQDNPMVMRGLFDLSLVLIGGYRILKGEEIAGELFSFVRGKITPPRLHDVEIEELAEGFVSDYVSTRRKIARGELVAAQRWLHHQLLETNFRLAHELRQRRGLPSFPDARRLEFLGDMPEIGSLANEAALTPESLTRAVENAAETLRGLMRALRGELWRWPDLSPLRLRAE